VLTHYAHDAIEMAGGTTFYFVTERFGAAIRQAQAVASATDDPTLERPEPVASGAT